MRIGMLATAVLATAGMNTLDEPLAAVRQAGPNGQGSAAAAKAWPQLAAADVGQLPALLAGMDGANPVARNWIRAAVDEVLRRARAEKKPLPVADLETFLRDRKHQPQARRLAYELIAEADPKAPERFLPTMLDDPSPELRFDAVARLQDQAEQLLKDDKKAEALPLVQKAFAAARDMGQVTKLAGKLGEVGQPVDLPAHLGLVLDWKLLGPLPNPDGKAIDNPFPPEKAIDLKAAYPGKAGEVKWVDYVSKDKQGVIDLSAGLGGGPHTQVAGYAVTTFTSPAARTAEVRIGCYTAFKLFVNGELALHRADAFTGMKLDHYVGHVKLKEGLNTFLMKVTVDDIPPQVPKQWRFQLRVCDADGVAILSTTRPKQ